MEIQTTFNVHDLVETKRTTQGESSIVAHEIMEIHSETCYLDTQIYYRTRAIVGTREMKRPYSENNYSWKIDIAHGKDHNDMGWKRYREDELIPISIDVKNIIEGSPDK